MEALLNRVVPNKSNENDVRNLKNHMNSEMTTITISFNKELESLKKSLNNEVKQKLKTLTNNMQTLQLNVSNQIHNVRIESSKNFTEIDAMTQKIHRKLRLEDFAWIKTEDMLFDKNFSNQINYLVDELETEKIDMEAFARSTYPLVWEKGTIKLQHIDENFRKVGTIRTDKNAFRIVYHSAYFHKKYYHFY